MLDLDIMLALAGLIVGAFSQCEPEKPVECSRCDGTGEDPVLAGECLLCLGSGDKDTWICG